MKRKVLFTMSLIATICLFCLGQHAEAHEGFMAATAGVIALTEAEKATFTEPEKKMIVAVEKLVNELNGKIKDGAVTKGEVEAMILGIKSTLSNEELASVKTKLDAIEEAAKAQGTSLAVIEQKMQFGDGIYKSVGQVLQENEPELKKIFLQGSGTKQFMLRVNHKGQWVLAPFDATKAAGPHATVAAVGDGGNTSSISQTIDGVSLLRMGGNAQIQSQYRNSPWLFDLVNLVNAGWDNPFAVWYEEQAREGNPALTAEGATKTKVQYSYALKTATYKKVAALIGFTEEFALDFPRLQDDIINKGRIDVINQINANILTNILAAATAYNTASQFGGPNILNVNDFDAIAAMAAQVDSATFGSNANAALMSTFKKYRMGITKSTTGEYVDRPSVLDNISFVGNPAMGADDVVVGDLKQYNVIMRGGFLVKVGYNGNDFANNMFSVVLEQFYFDQIAAIRKPAIVKGQTFATVKSAIGNAGGTSGS